jgi:hypothetical protein
LVVENLPSGTITACQIQKGYTMSSFRFPTAMPAPIARSVAVAALLGATMLAGPLTAARADSVTNPAIQLAQAAQSPAGKGATASKGETVEQRITNLHVALKITPAQEAQWKGVAQDMTAMPVAHAQTNTRGAEVITNGPQPGPGEERVGRSAAQNVRDSERYESLVRSNPNFRALRERKECGPIDDPRMHADCVASFGK